MSFRSEKQRRAMYAAAKGKSKIGIPKKVAQRSTSRAGHAHAIARRDAQNAAAK